VTSVRDRSRAGALLVAAVLLTAVNLRTAVISVGPVLDELEAGVGLSAGGAGLLTTLPVLSFALLGSLTPRLARRHGERRVLCGALLLMTAALVARVLVSDEVLFLLLTVPALAGGAMGNVLLPVLVKRHFPARIGPMTAAYTTALATGTTVAAAATVPLASLRGHGVDWRLGLGLWALPAALGALVWVRPAVRDRPVPGAADVPRPAVHRSRTAWALALYFGSQSMQAYISFGWFALYFRERAGASATRAGLYVAVLAAVAVPVSAVVPAVAARFPDQRRVLAGLVACYVASYTGMAVSPGGAPLVWMVLAGLGGGTFPLALTMIGLRTRTTAGTASTSAFAQSVGYVIAGVGPLLVGVLHGATGGWTWPFVLLFADLVLMAVAGWYAAQPRYVEDDLRE
jgi:CP family cyanate transporter-like MFS transporter